MARPPRSVPAPIPVDPVLDDPALVERLVRANAPYWPVYRYFADPVQLRAAGAPVDDPAGPMRVPPWFRGDWAGAGDPVAELAPIADNPRFAEAARALYGYTDAAIVRLQLVYVNLTLPMPVVDLGHTDVPTFRGLSRRDVPIWLLSVMGHSGLFEPWRIRIATAVSWWYAGEGGGFAYWPDGPDAAPIVRPPTPNTALVGENERMYHRVERVGRVEEDDRFQGLTLNAELAAGPGGDWVVTDDGGELARVGRDRVRISVSWKAEVFADEAEVRAVEEHLDDLSVETVCAILVNDLRDRGVAVAPHPDLLVDPAFISQLTEAHTTTPTVFPRAAGIR